MKRYARPGIGLIVALPALRTVLPGDFGQESGRYQSIRKSGWAFRGRPPQPSHDDLLGTIHLLVDRPACADQTLYIVSVFADVVVLADHRLALTWTSGAQLARRERATDLGPERRPRLRLDASRRSLDAFVDRIPLHRQTWPRGGHRRRLTRLRRHVPPAKAADDGGVLDLLCAEGASAHGRKASAHRASASGATFRPGGS